jgi:glycosyltransferase involved in cell wall biosynthesis
MHSARVQKGQVRLQLRDMQQTRLTNRPGKSVTIKLIPELSEGAPELRSEKIGLNFIAPKHEWHWMARRWTPKHLWYRVRLPIRRRKWATRREEIAMRYVKSPGLSVSKGPAVVFGDFSGANGLSRAAIYDLKQLKERHSEVRAVDISACISGNSCEELISRPIENAYFLCQPDTYENVLRLASPEALQNAYRVGRWVWETPVFPKSWGFAESIVHTVWAPSKFCAETFQRSLGVSVHVVPHAVTKPLNTLDMRQRLGIGRDAFMGLANMDIRSCPMRKNPWGHVLAWQKAFGADKSAVLVLKIRTGKRTAIVARELKELSDECGNVIILRDDLSDAEIGSLQHACDVFLSLHRAEGYGLNVHEALLCGKPTLATDWSANSEYGTSFPNYRGIRYRMTSYRDWTAHYEDDFSWAEPDLEHAANELRNVRTGSAK